MSLKLYRKTGNGSYLTLAGAGVITEILLEAMQIAGADPNDVVLRFTDGSRGAHVDVMFPTPHTALLELVHIVDGEIRFMLKMPHSVDAEDKYFELPLANPDVADKISDAIMVRAKKHRRTRIALSK